MTFNKFYNFPHKGVAHFLLELFLLLNWMWWYMSIVPTFGKLRQEGHEFEASLSYIEFQASLGCIVRPCLKNKKQKTKNQTKLFLLLS
jgi:hypothetical protein